ncbi:MAG: hypothetical protein RSC78_04060 [Acidaminococcaceae bacterium]
MQQELAATTGRVIGPRSIEVLGDVDVLDVQLATVELAETVRDALDGAQGEIPGLVMRSCYLVDSEEAWQDDAYVQQLVFNVKI